MAGPPLAVGQRTATTTNIIRKIGTYPHTLSFSPITRPPLNPYSMVLIPSPLVGTNDWWPDFPDRNLTMRRNCLPDSHPFLVWNLWVRRQSQRGNVEGNGSSPLGNVYGGSDGPGEVF